MFPGEVEIAPGIYLTKKEKLKEHFLGNPTPGDELEYWKQELFRLQLSNDKLLESNVHLSEFSDDPECVEALEENLLVIERQKIKIKELQQKIQQLDPTCIRIVPQMTDVAPTQESEEGVYL